MEKRKESFPLFSSVADGEKLKKEGMARAEMGAGWKWNVEIRIRYIKYAEMHLTFTGNDFNMANLDCRPPNGFCAWGPITTWAMASEIVKPIGWTLAAGASAHRRGIRVLRSLIYKPKGK